VGGPISGPLRLRATTIWGLAVVLMACSAPGLDPEIPVAGAREPITRENLVAAREGMAEGLLEPGWLPDGFALVNAEYIESGGRVWSVDLFYEHADGHSVHIWQTRVSPEDLGAEDPVALAEPMPSSDWSVNPLSEAQVGRAGVVEYSSRLDDGRTVTVDTDLDRGTSLRVLESLILRSSSGTGDEQ
jgi:hypothetical protein